MYQVKFDPEEFARIVPWLMLNRGGLNILVHPETTDAYIDHAVNALWLGEKLMLRLDVLRGSEECKGWMKTCRITTMGASGAGVTSIGRALADALD